MKNNQFRLVAAGFAVLTLLPLAVSAQSSPSVSPGPETITTSSYPTNGGTTTGGGINITNLTVTVKAKANTAKGFVFINWTTNGTIASTNAIYTFPLPPTNEALLANFGYTVSTSSSPGDGGATGGKGAYVADTMVAVTAEPDSCFHFVKWTEGGKTVSTETNYPFLLTNDVMLVADFSKNEYTLSAAAFPGAYGSVTGAGSNQCGARATLTAHPKPGFKLLHWINLNGGAIAGSNTTLSVTVTSNANFQADFVDDQPPTLKVTAPTQGEKVPTAAFTLAGTATDNVAVWYVAYSLNAGQWAYVPAGNGAPWKAPVTLDPNTANVLKVFAVDTSGNATKTNTITFECTAAGLAPMSIAGQLVIVTQGAQAPFVSSFDTATYVKMPADTNDTGEVGTYTYMPTGSNSAELVLRQALPPGVSTNASVLELTFTDAYRGTFTNVNDATGGTISIQATEESVPATLDGAVVISSSAVERAAFSTNIFGRSTYTNTDSQGGSSGTYTYTPFTAVGALVVQTSTNEGAAGPAAIASPATNYIVMTFNEGETTISGSYYYVQLNGTTNVNSDQGTFVATPGTDSTVFLGPVTHDGLQATVTPAGEHPYIESFGRGTFASISETNTEPTAVGISLGNTRVTADTGVDSLMALAPPYAAGQDEGTVITFLTSSSNPTETFTADYVVPGAGTGTTANSVVPVVGVTGTLKFSKAANFAPASVSGHTAVFTPTHGSKTTVKLINNTFIAEGGAPGTGTYTYAPYTPTMALVQYTATGGSAFYTILQFTSAAAGNYVYASMDSHGDWQFTPGTFTLSP